MVQYLKNSNKYQILLTLNTNSTNNKNQEPIQEIISKINRNIPTIDTDLTGSSLQILSSTSSLNDSKATTIFIMIYDLKESTDKIYKGMDFVIQLSSMKIRPYYLLIIFSEKNNFRGHKLFQLMWSRRFLDVTILELVKTTSKEKERNFPSEENLQKYVPMIHNFNPFSKVYTKKRFSTKTIWFPDKLLNLHELTLKVGLFHRPPFVYLKRNTSNHPIHFCGTDVQRLLALSKTSNFKIDLVPSDKEIFGKYDCDRNKTDGFLYKLFHNEIELIADHSFLGLGCNKHLADFIIIGSTDVSALVPTIRIENSLLQARWKIYCLVLMILFFLGMWFLALIFKFDSELWSITYTVQAIFGATVTREPKKLKERIVFGSLLIVSALCSSAIFGIFTDVSLKIKPKMDLNSLEELEKSDIEFQAEENFVKALIDNSEGVLQKLLQKTVRVMNSNLDGCVEKLLKYRNVACFMRKQVAKNFIRVHRGVEGDSVMKVVEDPLITLLEVILMEPGSPYVGRFHKVLTHLEEAGLIHKWDQDQRCELSFQFDKKDQQGEEKEEPGRLQHLLICILLIGYFLSFLVFVTEVLIDFV